MKGMSMQSANRVVCAVAAAMVICGGMAEAQTRDAVRPGDPAAASQGIAVPPDYVIGAGDALSVIYWKNQDMSAEVLVRPDGKISLPLLNDLQAAGLTPDQLRAKITEGGSKYVESPAVMVIVKEIKSRNVFITGQVAKSGPYPLLGPMTVLQLIAVAGGLQEFADAKNIAIIRMENGQPVSYRFNYAEVLKRKNLKQNIELKPGDQVVVP